MASNTTQRSRQPRGFFSWHSGDRGRLAGQLRQPGGRGVAIGEAPRLQLALVEARGLVAAAPLNDRADEPAGAVDVPLRLAGSADAGELEIKDGHTTPAGRGSPVLP